MGSIRLQNVTKQFGPQIVLDRVALDLHTGETAALIGANGAGKTTLLKLITGDLSPDLGTVTRSKGLEVGYLSQDPDVPRNVTVRAAVAEAFSELLGLEEKLHDLSDKMAREGGGPRLEGLMQQYDRINARFEAAGGYTFEQRLNEVLGGLGFAPGDYDLPVAALSGGQRCRAALARLLLEDRQYLLLDEPTNHLDIDAVRWLEKFLAGHHGGALIISHDRYLLDRLAQRTIELTGGRVYSYPGNYSNYVQTRAVRRLTQARQYEKDREYIAKEREFIARHMAGQRTREAQGRLKRLERQMEAGEFVLEKPGAQRTLKLDFGSQPREKGAPQQGKEVIHAAELAKHYGEKRLFDNLNLTIYTGQRLGITGPNGTGKTTLLKIILGQVAATAGEIEVSPKARVGYFAQDADRLNPEHTIIDEIQVVRPDLLERSARRVAARFLFTDEDPYKQVHQLSGGEQSRVRFMKLILTSPDVLILDEPTNHLDIPSRENLERALNDFPGTIVAVSHDRYFLDRIVQQLLVIRPDGHALYNGNYSYYIAQVEQQRAAAETADNTAASPKKKRAGSAKRDGQPVPPRRDNPYAKMKLEELEVLIHEHEEQLNRLEVHFGDADVYRDPDKLARLRAKFDEVRAALTLAEEEWLHRAEQT